MIVLEDIAGVRAARSSDLTSSWGLVPTMGFLHEGHLSLVRQARAENDVVAVSIFVNPTQFAPHEDLGTYPRDLQRDLALLAAERVDYVFVPQDHEMYPAGFQTRVVVEEVTRPLEGLSRPTHFQGVTTVVAKLFNIFQPKRAYFGQKDAQQTVVVRRMVVDLDFPLELVICPTVREPDGLAMSSRNAKLTTKQRKAATILFRALSTARDSILAGESSGARIRELMEDVIASESLARLDYVSVASSQTLAEIETVAGEVLISLAVYFGEVRLIDNTLVRGTSPDA